MRSFHVHSTMRCEKGLIHSIESFGTVDGPGVRMVIFFQGCPLRCLYCHNPDTWKMDRGEEMSADDILSMYEKNRAFYEPRGGITATGGEPLMQLGFLTSLFAEARRRGIHTVLDTSGWLYRKELDSDYDELLSCTDYVLLDIKHSNPQGHIDLTGRTQEPVLAFLSKLDEKHIPTMIRHVSVPGITDSEDELSELGRILAHHDNITGLDVLPYHTMGIRKYHEMDIPYHLEGVPAMARDEARKNRDIIIEAYHRERSRLNLKYGS